MIVTMNFLTSPTMISDPSNMSKQFDCTKMPRYKKKKFFALWGFFFFLLLLFWVSKDHTLVRKDVCRRVKNICLRAGRWLVIEKWIIDKEKLMESRKTLKNILIGSLSLLLDIITTAIFSSDLPTFFSLSLFLVRIAADHSVHTRLLPLFNMSIIVLIDSWEVFTTIQRLFSYADSSYLRGLIY